MCRGSLRFPGQIYSVLYLVKRSFFSPEASLSQAHFCYRDYSERRVGLVFGQICPEEENYIEILL